MNTGKFLFSIALLMISISCKKPDEFPDVPVITYKDIYSIRNSQGLDQKMTVLLNFTDGDGDVGYKDIGQNGAIYDDPTSIYYNNYQAKLFQFENEEWVEKPTLVPLGGRLPYLTPIGKNKALKGEISCAVDVPLHAFQDTFRLEIFIYDRALHQSNTVTTSEIILTTQ
jgi:hypothetical protein